MSLAPDNIAINELPDEQANTPRAIVGFWLAFAYLLLLAQILPHGGASDVISELYLDYPWILWSIFLLWSLIIVEAVSGVPQAPDGWVNGAKRALINSLIPPSRLALASAWPNDRIWLPRPHWQWCTEKFYNELEMKLTLPMLVITLLILPIMLLEILLGEELEEIAWLAFLLHHTTAFIWAAFAAEFILLVTVARKKITYCKQNWINIVIIILPLVGFLRSLRLFRVLRITKAGKLARAYRLRGLLLRAQRLALLFNLIERFLHRNPEKFLVTLREREHKKVQELQEIRDKISVTEQLIAEQKASANKSE